MIGWRQIYADKVEADLVDDRERTPRMGLPEFVYDWHLNRYGLRRLADANLLDLITSVRHWAGGNLKLRLFAQVRQGTVRRNPYDTLARGALPLLLADAAAGNGALAGCTSGLPLVSLLPHTHWLTVCMRDVKKSTPAPTPFRPSCVPKPRPGFDQRERSEFPW